MTELSTSGVPLVSANRMPGLYTVETLPPVSPEMVGMYAKVTNLYGEKTDDVLCSKAGTKIFWQPVRPTYEKTISANQNMTLTPLKSPSVIFLTGTLLANRTITLSTDLVYPGAEFRIAMDGSLGLFGLNIIGVDSIPLLSLLVGGRRNVYWDADLSVWKQF